MSVRIRTLKPEFWSSISIGRLSLGARLTFIGLWNYADDEGRGVFEPRLIRAALWPLEDATTKQVTGYLREIAEQELIQVYEDSGRTYFAVPSWKEHQSISKPKPSRLPAPSEISPGLFPDVSETSPRRKGKEQGTGLRRPGVDAILKACGGDPMAATADAKRTAAVKLAAIRVAEQQRIGNGFNEDDPVFLAEIERRAKRYAAKWPTWALTPAALAQHWHELGSDKPAGPPPAGYWGESA